MLVQTRTVDPTDGPPAETRGALAPRYSVDAVDNTLQLLELLWRAGSVRVSSAANELGVARSTAHRLLRMLVYRGFAVQLEDRSYVPGPSLARPSVAADQHTALRECLSAALDCLHTRFDETVNLVVRDWDSVVFLDSRVPTRDIRVNSLVGGRLPAERTSGGKALLAHLSPPAVRALYVGRPEVDLAHLERTLQQTRRAGHGLNVDESRPGISAIGVCVPSGDHAPHAAVTVCLPTMRFRRSAVAEVAAVLHQEVGAAVRAWTGTPLQHPGIPPAARWGNGPPILDTPTPAASLRPA